jgi:hypothetical protein
MNGCRGDGSRFLYGVDYVTDIHNNDHWRSHKASLRDRGLQK